MKKHVSAAAATYGPQSQKNFAGALNAFFKNECPAIGGNLTRRALVASVVGMVGEFYPETTHLRPGQTPWVTVDKNERPSYGKKTEETALTVVNLTLVTESDAVDRADGMRLREIKKNAAARLCKEAYEQGGCLTAAELGVLLKVSTPTIGKYIAEWESDRNEVLPRRGSIHDMGPTFTHKKIIIRKLFLEGETVQATSRQTYHSLPAIQRYIEAFKQSLLCYRKGMSLEDTAYAMGRTKRLVKEYFDIIEEYGKESAVLKKILNTEIKVESNPEKFANEYCEES